MRELPPPEFVKIDLSAVEADLIARYEARAGKTLYPAQIERLLINQITYAHGLALNGIQSAAEKLLVRHSEGVILDYLGELVRTPRLLATPARCKLRLSKREPSTPDVLVSAGTRISTVDGRVAFVTDRDVLVGATPALVDAVCVDDGVVGNGWVPGQVSAFDGPASIQAINTTETAGGVDDETDERYKERIIMAPEAYSTAGSYGAYRYWAMSAHQSIVDVAVRGPTEGEENGHVALYPLTEQGLPSQPILALVEQAVSSETRRPLCDTVLVRPPVRVAYQIRAALTFFAHADRGDAMERASQALHAYVSQRQRTLGADQVPEQITGVLQVPGVYRTALMTPKLRELASHEWGDCTSVELVDGGQARG